MLIEFFTDPILRAPTLGAMLMCLISGLVGVPLFLRKKTLLGEALSHAAYPGVVLGAIFSSFFFLPSDEAGLYLVLLGAFVFSFLGLLSVEFLEKKCRVNVDAALCIVLASFFGFGVLFASRMQFSQPLWYKQVQVFLYGQAATLTDEHLFVYILLGIATVLLITMYYQYIKIIYFDRVFAKSIGVKTKSIEAILFSLVALSIVIGIRSVGVILMSGMLIAPAAAARMLTHRLSHFFLLSALFGTLSGFLGNVLSLKMSAHIVFPTGPMILIVASSFCFLLLFFAPKRGLLFRKLRAFSFKWTCLLENTLKALWKRDTKEGFSTKEVGSFIHTSFFFTHLILFQLHKKKLIEKKGTFHLTPRGRSRAARIVRLHRLWEVYLAEYIGVEKGKVHRNAEEMEHIITEEIERELTLILENPKIDPHEQPIPPLESL